MEAIRKKKHKTHSFVETETTIPEENNGFLQKDTIKQGEAKHTT